MKKISINIGGFEKYNLIIVLLSILYFLIRPDYNYPSYILWAILLLSLASLLLSFLSKRKILNRLPFAIFTVGFLSLIILTNLGDLLSIGGIYTMNYEAISILKDHVDEIPDNDTTGYWLVESENSQLTNEEKLVLRGFFNKHPGVRVTCGYFYYPIGNSWTSFPFGYAYKLGSYCTDSFNYNDCYSTFYRKITRNWYSFSAICIY